MTPIEKLLDILTERDLLPEKLLRSLRQQVAKASTPIRPEALARQLIEAGHLTPALAKRLLASLPETEAGDGADGAEQPGRRKDTPRPGATAKKGSDEDDLELAPLDTEDAWKPVSVPKAAKPTAGMSPSSAGQRPKASTPMEPQQAPPGTSRPAGERHSRDSAVGVSPLDSLLAAEGMDAAAAAGSPLLPLTRRGGLFGWLKRGRRAPGSRRGKKAWDSPVLLLSGGLLAGLLVLGAVLIWALGRQSGDEVLAAANEEYRAGSYTQAIHKFDQYLRRFPRHQGASSARVTRGLARLRQATLEGGNWPAALATAQQVIKEISPEEAFGESAGELAAMLPAIAEGLATGAHEGNDPELLGQAREAVELAANRMIVPARLQPTAKLTEIEAQIALVQRQIDQGTELNAAVAAIQNALAQADPPLAYEIRQELLRTYPALADDPKLTAATKAISAAQKMAVRVTGDAMLSGAELPASPILATLTLAERTTRERVSGVEGEVLVTVAEGAAYGLDATDGRLMWKRFLGDAPDGLRAPVAATSAPGGDVFVLSPPLEEVWRIDARTGQLRWRLPLGEPVDVPPVLAREQLVVATRGGRLHLIDAGSGTSIRQIQLPQPVPVAPAVDTRRGLIYQAADHSNLFVLALDSGECLDVIHLGHTQGSLAAAPAMAADMLLVTVNDRARTAVLRVYGTAEAAQADVPSSDSQDNAEAHRLVHLLQEFRARGQFDAPPVLAGRNVVALTDLGAVYAYELSAADPAKPLVPILQREAVDTEPLARYCLLHGTQLFVADDRLTKFDLRAAAGHLTPQWVSDEQSAFLQPPRAFGNAIVHVRRRVGEPGVVVAAVHADEGRMLWQNRIAVPPADRPIVQPGGQEVIAIGSTGSLFQIGVDTIRGETVLDEPAVDAGRFRRQAAGLVDLGDGALLVTFGPGSDQIALFSPSEQPNRYTWRMLPGELTSLPVLFRSDVLLPCLPGHLFLLDPRTNELPAEPFQPPLAPEGRLNWRLPAVGDGGHVAVTDGQGTLFALIVDPDPKPHFRPAATVELRLPTVAPLAATGNMVLAVDEAAVVAAYELPELHKRGEWTLGSGCTWGPARVGEHVLLATDAGQLLCFDAAAKLCWRAPMPGMPLAGASALNGHFLLATADGTLWRIDAEDGRELGRIETQRPLATAPVPIDRGVLIGGRSGSLYRLRAPGDAEGDLSGLLPRRPEETQQTALSAAGAGRPPMHNQVPE